MTPSPSSSPFHCDPSEKAVTIDLSSSPLCDQQLTPDEGKKRLAVGDIDEFKVTLTPERAMGLFADRGAISRS